MHSQNSPYQFPSSPYSFTPVNQFNFMELPQDSPFFKEGKITQVDDDLLQNILSKLPAKSFASAACVNRTWNDVCSRILSRPIFVSAVSSATELYIAVIDVAWKVLSSPIRPHFGILTVPPRFGLDDAHRMVVAELGTGIPIVTCESAGVIGRDALTDQIHEMRFPYHDDPDDPEPSNERGVSLTVGYVPGLKVDAVPLLSTVKGPSINKFVMDMRDFSASVSGCTSPEAIIMFGDSQAEMKPVLETLDCTLPQQTIIAGNECCTFRHSSINNSKVSTHHYDAVALVFARERTKLDGLGNIEFHFAVGAGITAIGPIYRVVSAKTRSQEFKTWLTAKREGENEILDGEEMLNDVDVEMEDFSPSTDLFIGVRTRRKYSVGSEQVKSVTSVAYHHVEQGDEQYLYVRGWDIKTGDTFRFYIPDTKYAFATCRTVSESIAKLKHRDIVGGFAFVCCGRGESFFGKSNVDCSPILDNFPTAPLAGIYCSAEIGRGSPNLGQCDNEQEQTCFDSLLHVYSSIYLLMSYSPPSSRP